MTFIDYAFYSVILALAAVHLYFGFRYRDHFVVSKQNINESYWAMIVKFKKLHPKPAQFLTAAIYVQVVVMTAFGICRLFK